MDRTKICSTCGKAGHVSKYCYTNKDKMIQNVEIDDSSKYETEKDNDSDSESSIGLESDNDLVVSSK